MSFPAPTMKESKGSYILRVSQVSNANLKNLVDQAKADESCELLTHLPSFPIREEVSSTADPDSLPPKTESPSRPTNSFLVRVTKKKKRRRHGKAKQRRKGKPDREDKSPDFLGKLEQDTKAGKVDCFKINNVSAQGQLSRRLSHQDLHMMARTGPKLPPEFQSSPGILGPRSSYYSALNEKRKSTKREIAVHSKMEQKDGGPTTVDGSALFNNSEIARVQLEYIEALESEVNRSKVSADLTTRSLKMEMARLEKLIAKRDNDLMHKDLQIQSLQMQGIGMNKAISQKDEIIAIQGEYVAGLEAENVQLNRKLLTHSIPTVPRDQSTSNLGNLYRRVSSGELTF